MLANVITRLTLHDGVIFDVFLATILLWILFTLFSNMEVPLQMYLYVIPLYFGPFWCAFLEFVFL